MEQNNLTNEIEEERTTVPNKSDRFDKRAQIFWNEMFGLLDLLNFNNDKMLIRTVESPVITDYLLWRLLNEIKLLKDSLETAQDVNTRFGKS